MPKDIGIPTMEEYNVDTILLSTHSVDSAHRLTRMWHAKLHQALACYSGTHLPEHLSTVDAVLL